jgi:hypothetical protein
MTFKDSLNSLKTLSKNRYVRIIFALIVIAVIGTGVVFGVLAITGSFKPPPPSCPNGQAYDSTLDACINNDCANNPTYCTDKNILKDGILNPDKYPECDCKCPDDKINDVDPKVCNDICGDTGASCDSNSVCAYSNVIQNEEDAKLSCVNIADYNKKCDKQYKNGDLYCLSNYTCSTDVDGNGNGYCIKQDKPTKCNGYMSCMTNKTLPNGCDKCISIFDDVGDIQNYLGYCADTDGKPIKFSNVDLTGNNLCCNDYKKISIDSDGKIKCCGDGNPVNSKRGNENSRGCCLTQNQCIGNCNVNKPADSVCTTNDGFCKKDNAYGGDNCVNDKTKCDYCCPYKAVSNICGLLSSFKSDIPNNTPFTCDSDNECGQDIINKTYNINSNGISLSPDDISYVKAYCDKYLTPTEKSDAGITSSSNKKGLCKIICGTYNRDKKIVSKYNVAESQVYQTGTQKVDYSKSNSHCYAKSNCNWTIPQLPTTEIETGTDKGNNKLKCSHDSYPGELFWKPKHGTESTGAYHSKATIQSTKTNNKDLCTKIDCAQISDWGNLKGVGVPETKINKDGSCEVRINCNDISETINKSNENIENFTDYFTNVKNKKIKGSSIKDTSNYYKWSQGTFPTNDSVSSIWKADGGYYDDSVYKSKCIDYSNNSINPLYCKFLSDGTICPDGSYDGKKCINKSGSLTIDKLCKGSPSKTTGLYPSNIICDQPSGDMTEAKYSCNKTGASPNGFGSDSCCYNGFVDFQTNGGNVSYCGCIGDVLITTDNGNYGCNKFPVTNLMDCNFDQALRGTDHGNTCYMIDNKNGVNPGLNILGANGKCGSFTDKKYLLLLYYNEKDTLAGQITGYVNLKTTTPDPNPNTANLYNNILQITNDTEPLKIFYASFKLDTWGFDKGNSNSNLMTSLAFINPNQSTTTPKKPTYGKLINGISDKKKYNGLYENYAIAPSIDNQRTSGGNIRSIVPILTTNDGSPESDGKTYVYLFAFHLNTSMDGGTRHIKNTVGHAYYAVKQEGGTSINFKNQIDIHNNKIEDVINDINKSGLPPPSKFAVHLFDDVTNTTDTNNNPLGKTIEDFIGKSPQDILNDYKNH